MKKIITISILINALFFLSFIGKDSVGTLTIEIKNLRNSNGTVGIAVFKSGNGFPSEEGKAYRVLTIPVSNLQTVAVISDLPAGEYAVVVIHDENNNGKMNTNKLGIPKEGYGASNDAKALFGPPSYEDARFNFNTEKKNIRIQMRYFEFL